MPSAIPARASSPRERHIHPIPLPNGPDPPTSVCDPPDATWHLLMKAAEIALDSLSQAFNHSTWLVRLILCLWRWFLASRIPLGRSAIYDVLVVPVRSFDLDRLPRTEVHRCLPRAPRQQPWPLFSWPTTGVPPHPLDEAVGFDSPVGRPSGTSLSALRKVRLPLAHARTRPLPMHCSRADSVCPFHCCRPLSLDGFRVWRPYAVQSKRACSDALVMCGAWVAAVVERVDNARSIAIAS